MLSFASLLEVLPIPAPTCKGERVTVHLCRDEPVKAPLMDVAKERKMRAMEYTSGKYKFRLTMADRLELRREETRIRRKELLDHLLTVYPQRMTVNQLRVVFKKHRSVLSTDLKALRDQGLINWTGQIPYFYWASESREDVK